MKVDAMAGPAGDRIYLLGLDPDKPDASMPNALLCVSKDLNLALFSEGNLVNSYSVSENTVALNQWLHGWRSGEKVAVYEENRFEVVLLDPQLKTVSGRQPHVGNHVKKAVDYKGKVIVEFSNDAVGSLVWTRDSGFARTTMKESIHEVNRKGVWLTQDKATGSFQFKREAQK